MQQATLDEYKSKSSDSAKLQYLISAVLSKKAGTLASAKLLFSDDWSIEKLDDVWKKNFLFINDTMDDMIAKNPVANNEALMKFITFAYSHYRIYLLIRSEMLVIKQKPE